jgi:hypothetical protein
MHEAKIRTLVRQIQISTQFRDQALHMTRLLVYLAEVSREISGSVCEMHLNDAVTLLMLQFDLSLDEILAGERLG